MPENHSALSTKPDRGGVDLAAAFDRTIRFDPSRGPALVQTDDEIRARADEEASFGRITVDDEGLTAGMRLHLLQPLRGLLAEWDRCKGDFMTAVRPLMVNIEALDKLDDEIRDLRTRRENVKSSIERRYDAGLPFSSKKQQYEQTKQRFMEMRDNQGRREPNLMAKNPWYWVALLGVATAEYFINYDTFFFFLGVPAIAAATTALMGVLLAFAADWHGKVLRQWSARFGEHMERRDRFSEYRMLAMSVFAFAIVVGTAAASRYEFAIHIIIDQPHQNILGDMATIQVNPLKDVTLSLLGNVAAWAVGVFIAYMTHDKSPDYMDAAQSARKAEKAFAKASRPMADEIKTQEAQIQREISEQENSANVRSGDVSEQRTMLHQVQAHEVTVLNSLASSLRQNAERYRTFLTQVAIAQRGATQLSQGDRQLTPYEYQAMKLPIDGPSLRLILA